MAILYNAGISQLERKNTKTRIALADLGHKQIKARMSLHEIVVKTTEW